MTLLQRNPVEMDVHDKVRTAIQGALREEKEPPTKRIFKIASATVTASVSFGILLLISFRSQMTWVWSLAFGFWLLYFLVGFALMFKPQPRLMVAGLWSPFVIARLILVSTVATILQIVICPSFVFLDSAIGWNPLSIVTEFLMRTGGMRLCMGFCGFLFSVIASSLGIMSIHRVAKAPNVRSSIVIFLILLASQIPIILVQVYSEESRSFSPFWIMGMLSGFFVILGTKWKWNRIEMQ